MAEIKKINLIINLIKDQKPKSVDTISAATGIHTRSVYRHLQWIKELSINFNYQLHKKNVNGSRYYHLTKLE